MDENTRPTNSHKGYYPTFTDEGLGGFDNLYRDRCET